MLDVGQLSGFLWLGLAILLGTSLLNLAVAVGLWHLKNWARILVIVMQVIGLLSGLVQAGMSVLAVQRASAQFGASSFPAILAVSLVLGFVIQGYIIFWFLANGELFD
jgi:hypothetical protein